MALNLVLLHFSPFFYFTFDSYLYFKFIYTARLEETVEFLVILKPNSGKMYS